MYGAVSSAFSSTFQSRKYNTSMNKTTSIALIAATVMLSSCAMGWSRSNTSESEFYQDRLQCEQQAMSIYPVAMSAMGGGYQTPARTNCTTYGNQTNCTTTPGTYTPPPQSDMNAIPRSGAFSACLRGKGYEFKLNN